ncbi:GDYXXLXY domain-containing protein [Myxococcus sp. K38C18041901]|uniref:GDYXXLXY domain-containing protein n=1 Tax=Myxococcus guangdongensis TaxID=2906760 RepID=UPI0020A70A02|nr:GDYXXLXY domain-containing protein [Myxococcus guangdongensis]MCP3058054.1 GDYXXLXY domain-containing protein [Myxococcus guangdongensis]
MRSTLFFVGLLLALAVPLGLVVQKERVLSTGKGILLELAPRDPRSLMQGDYMVLDYALTRDLNDKRESFPHDGVLVLKLDGDGVGTFARMDSPDVPLAPDEHRLRYRIRDSRFRLGAESFFFQEGHAGRYQRARYAELKTADNGNSVLAGLRDKERQPLGADSAEDVDATAITDTPDDVDANSIIDAPTTVDAPTIDSPTEADAATHVGAPADASPAVIE